MEGLNSSFRFGDAYAFPRVMKFDQYLLHRQAGGHEIVYNTILRTLNVHFEEINLLMTEHLHNCSQSPHGCRGYSERIHDTFRRQWIRTNAPLRPSVAQRHSGAIELHKNPRVFPQEGAQVMARTPHGIPKHTHCG